MNTPLIVQTIDEVRTACAILQGSLGLVPTMGALHEGHLTLVREARKRCRHVAVSIFVNPLQFGKNEDLSSYPRPLERDIALLKEEGVSLIFTPDAHSLYPEGFSTMVQVNGLDTMLCGTARPGHFSGVTTVVTMLLLFLRPTYAFFGEKDYQQLCIIRRLNKDLMLVDDIIGVPTVREKDGLALSSRNQYLSAEERAKAPMLHATLQKIRSEEIAIDTAHKQLEEAGFALDYLEMRDVDTLQETDNPVHARLFIAARLGQTRLIDNIAAS